MTSVVSGSIFTDSKASISRKISFSFAHSMCVRFIYCYQILLVYFRFPFIQPFAPLSASRFPVLAVSHSLYNHHINHETMFVEPYMLAMMVGQWSHSSRMWGEIRCEWNYIRNKLNKLMNIEYLPNKLCFCTMRKPSRNKCPI